MITNQMLEDIVMEVLRRMDLDSNKKPYLLVVNWLKEKSETQIEELKRYWNVVEMGEDSCEIPIGIQSAVFLNVDQDLLVKGALGITDTPISLLFSKLMHLDYKVNFVPNNSLSWSLDENKEKLNKKYLYRLLHYHSTLLEFGVRICPLNQIIPTKVSNVPATSQKETSEYYTEKLLSKEQIEKRKNGSFIRVQSGTVITPLARDVARERGITIYELFQKG